MKLLVSLSKSETLVESSDMVYGYVSHARIDKDKKIEITFDALQRLADYGFDWAAHVTDEERPIFKKLAYYFGDLTADVKRAVNLMRKGHNYIGRDADHDGIVAWSPLDADDAKTEAIAQRVKHDEVHQRLTGAPKPLPKPIPITVN